LITDHIASDLPILLYNHSDLIEAGRICPVPSTAFFQATT